MKRYLIYLNDGKVVGIDTFDDGFLMDLTYTERVNSLDDALNGYRERGGISYNEVQKYTEV